MHYPLCYLRGLASLPCSLGGFSKSTEAQQTCREHLIGFGEHGAGARWALDGITEPDGFKTSSPLWTIKHEIWVELKWNIMHSLKVDCLFYLSKAHVNIWSWLLKDSSVVSLWELLRICRSRLFPWFTRNESLTSNEVKIMRWHFSHSWGIWIIEALIRQVEKAGRWGSRCLKHHSFQKQSNFHLWEKKLI